jgi:hypothetical protein
MLNFRSMVIGLVFASVPMLPAAIVIDYDACKEVPGYTQARMNAIAHVSYYFEHASVGGNMVDGLNSLHSGSSTFYQLTTESSSSTPGSTTGGVVYEYARGNPGWQTKVDDFTADIANWAGHTDFAMTKFCFIDQDADASYYLNAMAAIESDYAGTHFVYMTMPLTTGEDADNIDRNEFNTAVRQWVTANDKILFDVADIEAHNPSGVEQTFTDSGNVYQKLYSGYTTDGGHLDVTAGAELAALGFYALGNTIVEVPEPGLGWIGMGLACAIIAIRRRK